MGDRAPEFGLILTSQFNAKWEYVASDARAAEEAGLDSIWLADHLLQPGSPDGDIHEAWTALAALAASTERVRLGHLVNCVSFRIVGLLAKMAATVDRISDGRLELGLGAGWHQPEYDAFGYEFPPAGDRRRAVEETIDALDLLFAGGAVDFDGDHVVLRGARCHPGPVQQPRPPITIGTGGPMMRALTGRKADAWNCPAGLIPELDDARATVIEAAAGRSVRTTLQIPAAVGRSETEAQAALDVGRMHLAWMGDVAAIGLTGTVNQAAERVAEYQAQGVDGFICAVPGTRMRPDFIAALGELAEAVRRGV